MDVPLPRSIDVASVVDAQHGHGSSQIIDSIQDAVRSASSTEDASKFSAEFSAYAVRVLDERASDEVEDCRCNVFR